MKKLVLLSVAIILSGIIQAQYELWSDPVVLTDSLSYNSDPAVLVLSNSSYMFYEKKWDSISQSMIYYRDIENMTDEQVLLSNESFEYRNPHLFDAYFSPYSDFLIYESDEDGNFDIYAMEILDTGVFGNITKLTETTSDENSTSIVYNNYQYSLCWESNNNIYIAKLTMQSDSLILDYTTLIDSNNCFDPVCTNTFVAYRRIEEDSSHIYYAEIDSLPSYWSNPVPVDTNGNNLNLSIFQNEFSGNNGSLFWEKDGTIMCYHYEINQIEIPGSQITEVHQPNAFLYTPPVKSIPESFITFISNIDGNQDVFAFYNCEYNEPSNLSNNNAQNSNPKFFVGWETGVLCEIYLLDIWESQTISGGTTLNISKTPMWVCGGIDDNNANSSGLLKFSPNPFSGKTNIEFYQTEGKPVSIDVYSIYGSKITGFEIPSPEYGWNTLIWNPEKKLAKGVYSIMLRQGNYKEVKKIIYN